MDADRFDLLARSLITPSRRGFSRALAGLGLVGGLNSLLGTDEAEAKKKKKKCKKKCGECQQCKKGKCKPKPDGTSCSNDQVCQGGACPCPTECCADADCPSGEECLANGSCAKVCTQQEDCPLSCGGCSFPSVEGPQHCIEFGADCAALPPCTSTAQCPAGHQCQATSCPGEPTLCFPLCSA